MGQAQNEFYRANPSRKFEAVPVLRAAAMCLMRLRVDKHGFATILLNNLISTKLLKLYVEGSIPFAPSNFLSKARLSGALRLDLELLRQARVMFNMNPVEGALVGNT